MTRPGHTEHPLAIFDAMVRQARRGDSLRSVILRTPEHVGGTPVRPGAKVSLELLVTGGDSLAVREFARVFREKIFSFAVDGAIQIDDVIFEPRKLEPGKEASLWFRTPLPVRAKKGNLRLSASDLSNLIAARVKAVFGVAIAPPATAAELRVLTHFSKYMRFSHAAKSSPGEMWLHGHVGPILLCGDYRSLWPWLCLCEQIGLGKELGFGLGQFRLDVPAPPLLSARWARLKDLTQIAEDIVDRYDSAQVELATESAIPFDATAVASRIGEELENNRYVPAPHQAFVIQKKDGGERIVEFPTFRDLIVANHLKRLLEHPIEALFEPSSLGFRKGRSREDAAARIDAAVAGGYTHVLESDIEDFFPSVEHDRLEILLRDALPMSDEKVVDCIMRLVRAGYVLDGKPHLRERGLAQGNPLSPLLANLYLDAFDEALGDRGARLVRYADDFVILTRSRAEAESVLQLAEENLQIVGLRLNTAKTRVAAVADGFAFLGMRFPREGPEALLPLPVHAKKPLYITEPGVFVATDGDAVVLRKKGVVHDSVPLRRVSGIHILSYGAVSNALLRRCATFGVPISFCIADGYHVNTVAPDSRLFFEVSYRQGRRYHQLSEAERLEIGRMLVEAKISNTQALFRQRHNDHTASAVAELSELSDAVREAPDLPALRGLEGLAARKAFAHWAGLIDTADFEFVKRKRERPDRVNSLLNFGYHLLFGRLNAIVRGLGLNPYLGFLHESGDRYETLVCDLQEPFRANVDRLILTLINQRSIRPEDFQETPRGLRLTTEASRSFILAFERMLARSPRGGTGMPPAAALYAQALSMKHYLCDGGGLQVYQWQPTTEGL